MLGQSHPDASVFKFSKYRKQHGIDKLKQNLIQLLSDSPASQNDTPVLPSQEILKRPEMLVGQRIKHQFEVDGTLKWYEGTILNMNEQTREFEVLYDDEDAP